MIASEQFASRFSKRLPRYTKRAGGTLNPAAKRIAIFVRAIVISAMDRLASASSV
jgi:hypothetical protein